MRTIVINIDRRVEEHDLNLDEVLDGRKIVMLPFDASHDIVHEEDAMFSPGLVIASVGKHARVPLPAYIVGTNGEDEAPATVTIEDVISQLK